jgi:uncharacterized protein (TIGR03086 family)
MTASQVEPVELLERAIAYALGALRGVEPGLLSRPTPCSRWNLHVLLRHTADSLEALCEAFATRRISPAERPRPAPGDPVGAVRASACRLLSEAMLAADPDRRVLIGDHVLMTGVVVWTGALEIAGHGWDIGQTCGTDRPVPAALADSLLAVAGALITDEDRRSQFAAPVAVPRGVSPGDRLVAFLGRRPAV